MVSEATREGIRAVGMLMSSILTIIVFGSYVFGFDPYEEAVVWLLFIIAFNTASVRP